ncbi:hypothetical protein ACVWXM_009983 [Bradyrhizobium sp. GM7.3]
MTGVEGEAPAQLAFVLGVTRRLWLDMNTLSLYSGGALWPR